MRSAVGIGSAISIVLFQLVAASDDDGSGLLQVRQANVATVPREADDVEELGDPLSKEIVRQEPDTVTSCAVFPNCTAPTRSAQDLTESLIVLAEMAANTYAYETPDMKEASEWATTQAGYKFVGCDPEVGYATDPTTYTPKICFLKQEQKKQVVIAIQGTWSLEAAEHDVTTFLGGCFPMDAYQRLLANVTTWQAAGYGVLVTGHSLGGYYSELIASYLELPGISWNGPGVDAVKIHSGVRYCKPSLRMHPDFHAIHAWSDTVGNWGWTEHTSTPFFVAKIWAYMHVINVFWLHSIQTMYETITNLTRKWDPSTDGFGVTNRNIPTYGHKRRSWTGARYYKLRKKSP